MADESTCGQGLARHAELFQLVAELVDAVADNLSTHVPALVASDRNSQEEQRVYEQLAASQREAAASLHAVGAAMAAQQDLPMGEHDVDAMSPAAAAGALARMIGTEEQLIAHLGQLLDEHEAILDRMRS
jgi:hypothetical protein